MALKLVITAYDMAGRILIMNLSYQSKNLIVRFCPYGTFIEVLTAGDGCVLLHLVTVCSGLLGEGDTSVQGDFVILVRCVVATITLGEH